MTTARTIPPPSPPAHHRRWLLIGAIAGVALVAALGAVAAFTGDAKPRLNDNAVALTKFMGSGAFEKLAFDEQRQYYKVMDDRDKELDQAFASGTLKESEYRNGLEAAWLGKHINRVEKYFSIPPGQGRSNYIAKLLEKKEKKETKSKSGAKSNTDDIDADETAAELKVEQWPPAMRKQWEDFHDAYRAQRKAAEKAAKPASKPG